MKITKKILAAVLILGLITVVGISWQKHESPDKTMVKTIELSGDIRMEPRQTADQNALIEPYGETYTFLSEEENPGFEFTSVGGSWEESEYIGGAVETEIQFKVDGEWTEWLKLEEEIESELNGKVKKYAMASSNPATAMRYKFLIYSDGNSTPVVTNAKWTFIRASENVDLEPQPQPKFAASSLSSNSTYLALTSNNSGVVSRSAWGADESLRYIQNTNAYGDAELVELGTDFYTRFKDELALSSVVDEDETEKKYIWPLQYPEKVRKFIIHHTATTKNLDNPAQAIRDIYYYHAVTRGWGDIGYNYIVDRDGRIYEGRYGGEGVIGAHSGAGNNGSIGIAVLGNYEVEDVPEKVTSSISSFIAKKATLHGIQPDGSSLFRGDNMENIFAHRDIMSTTCPGAYLYAKLTTIRKLAAEGYAKPAEKPKFVKDYDYIDESNLAFVDLKPGLTAKISIKMENIGKVDWNKETFIVVNKNPEFDGAISFPGSDPVILAVMNETLVKPGQIATFSFNIKPGDKNKTVYMKIAPVVNGTVKIDDYIVLPINIEQKDYKYEFIDAKELPISMEKGEELETWVKLKNTGNITWTKGGENTVVLGADHPRDRTSKLVSPQSSRMGYLEENEVKPGDIGTFALKIKAPNESGYFKEYFTPVVEGKTWMQDSGMYFETTVFSDIGIAELVGQTSAKDWKRGESYVIWAELRNIGNTTWLKDDMSLSFIRSKNLEISGSELAVTSVKPGETAMIRFVVTVKNEEALGARAIMLRPKLKDKQIYAKPIYFYYNVLPGQNIVSNSGSSQSTTSSSKSIRIKLGFSGIPEIAGSGAFEVHGAEGKIADISSTQTVKVNELNGKYQVSIDAVNSIKNGPIRFIPKTGTILQIKNYNHAPAWNPALNDNEYRGVLEVQTVDTKLVVINELPLEDYLKGLAEASNTDPMEKIKAVVVAARSYAQYYMEVGTKFPGKPYNLDDDPNVSQRYLGYGFEKRGGNVAAAVDATSGQVVLYNGEIVKTPYFSQSDGTMTKNAKDVWNWDTPYLVAVDDSWCKETVFAGHGVGLSGCGARGMAEAGYSYLEILKHYYTGVEVNVK